MNMIKYFIILFISFSVLSCAQDGKKDIKQRIKKKNNLVLVDAFPSLPNFSKPVYLTHANDQSGRVFVVEQEGKIWSIDTRSQTYSRKLFLDIRNRVNSSGWEEGLLSIAFHPQFKRNKYFFVNYTASNPRRSVISRFSLSQTDSTIADPNSEYIILQINQPYDNHNGGLNLFGSDGYLYIGMGDGGSAGDPHNYAQNLRSLLGKILRINIDSAQAPLRYSIPIDNPYKGNTQGYREEIWASGLRNPWRFSFDPVTNWLYCADVGQNEREEINIISKGKNYGWRCYEGNLPYNLTGCGPVSLYTFPIKEYNHSLGRSITGGYVYRGTRIPSLFGAYIYGDFVSGRIWMLRYNGNNIIEDSLLFETNYNISSFGEDEEKELYICAFNGRIYKIQASPINVKDSSSKTFFHQLYQNYPNPFNQQTKIRFSLLNSAFVNLFVSDVLGNRVANLAEEIKPAGNYEVVFGANNLPSGVYIYTLKVDEFVKNLKMILLK